MAGRLILRSGAARRERCRKPQPASPLGTAPGTLARAALYVAALSFCVASYRVFAPLADAALKERRAAYNGGNYWVFSYPMHQTNRIVEEAVRHGVYRPPPRPLCGCLLHRILSSRLPRVLAPRRRRRLRAQPGRADADPAQRRDFSFHPALHGHRRDARGHP